MNKLQTLTSKLPDDKECALITSGINRRYFTEFKSSAGVLIVFKDEAYLLIDFRYYEKAVYTIADCTVIKEENRYKQLLELMKKHNAKTVSIEADTTTVTELESLSKNLPGINIDCSPSLSNSINAMRSVKSPNEIQKIRTAQRIAEKAFNNVLNHIKEGVTEKQLAYALDDYIRSKNNAEDISFETIVLSGANTSVPHGEPSGKTVRNGEFILMDFGAVYDGYHSDMTRTVCLGEPNTEMEQVYNIVLEAQKRALEMFKPGVSCKAADSAAREYITSQGFKDCFGHGLGHSVGLEIHEKPACNTRDESIFEVGNIMTCEPGIYVPGKLGVRIEDMAVINEDGYENLTNTTKKLMIL